MRQIVVFPDKILRVKTPEIEAVDAQLLAEIEDLKSMLVGTENGAGLAAPQIGLAKRFLGIKKQIEDKTEIVIMVNPKIIKTEGDKVFPKIVDDKNRDEDFLEGCLSFPNWWGTVKRYLKIEVRWQEIENQSLVEKSKIMTGFEAVLVQHELDHLDGILFVDHVLEDRGKFYKWNGKDKKMMKWNVETVIMEEK